MKLKQFVLQTTVLLMGCFIFPTQAKGYDFISDGIAYNITSATEMTVEVTWKSKYSWNSAKWFGCNYNGDLEVPQTVTHNNEVYTVTGIGEYAFGTETSTGYGDSYASALKSIILPESIEYIGKRAFYHSWGISLVTLPASLKKIDMEAFYDCENLLIVFLTSTKAPTCESDAFGHGAYGRCQIVVPHMSEYQGWTYKERTIEAVTFDTNSLTYSTKSMEIPWTSNLKAYNIDVEGNQTVVNAGNYVAAITLNCKKDSKSVARMSFELPYTIQKASLLFSIDSCSREYGSENPEFTYSINGFCEGDDYSSITELPKISSVAVLNSPVGKYPIIGTEGTAQNYMFDIQNGTLTVEKAPLTAKIHHASREYGCENPTFTMDFYGLKNGEVSPTWLESPIFTTSAKISSPIGEYTVSAIGIPRDYELTNITEGILTIKPAKLNVVAENKTRLYYEENPIFTFHYSGFRNNETKSIVSGEPILSTNATIESVAGEYEIVISDISAPNYEIVYNPGLLTINPRVLHISTGNYERAFGEENPTFELEYNGFVHGEGIKVLKSVPQAYTNAIVSSNVGTYPIYIKDGEALNYTFNYSEGSLNIVKADQEIVWNQDLSNLAVGQQVELMAYSTSGLPVSYTCESNNVCEIYSVGNKKYLDCKGEGNILIKCSQDGNQNYFSTPRSSKFVSVMASSSVKPTLTIKQLPVGSISTIVNWGEIYSFAVKSEANWEVNSITINGVDYTQLLDNNGVFTTPSITENATIVISYMNHNSGIENTSTSPLKILGYDGGVKIIGANVNDDILIYTIDGHVVKILKAPSDDFNVQLSVDKLYIVKIGAITTKIRI